MFAQRTCGKRHRKNDRTENTGRRVIWIGSSATELRECTLAQNSERRNCSQHRWKAHRQHQASGPDENDQEPAEPARDTTARVHQDNDHCDIDKRLRNGLNAGRDPTLVQRKRQKYRENQIRAGRNLKYGRVQAAEHAGFPAGLK